MGKTFSCTFEGCDLVFPREHKLRKHKAAHDDPDSVHYCPHCDFFSLDPRNLEVHIARHTGEKNYGCPDTIKVCEPQASGSLVEAPCEYRTNDRSLLTKHRVKFHKYIPRRRASPPRDVAITFIPYSVPSPAATRNTTSRGTNSKKRAKKRNATTKCSKSSCTHVAGEVNDSIGNVRQEALDSSFPSTLQEGVDEHGQMAHVDSPDATGSSSLGDSSAVSVVPNEHDLLGIHGQQTYVWSSDATSTLSAGSGDTTSVVPNEGISLDTYGQSADVDTSYAASSSGSTLVAPNQDISAGVLFNPAALADYHWSRFYEGFTASSALNLQTDTYATDGFQTMTSYDAGPNIMGSDASAWDNFWGQHDPLTYV